MAKILITTSLVNFVLIPSEAGMRQHKLTWIVVIKIFTINRYHHSHISWPPLWFHNFFHTGHFWTGLTFFLLPGCFWVDSIIECNSTSVIKYFKLSILVGNKKRWNKQLRWTVVGLWKIYFKVTLKYIESLNKLSHQKRGYKTLKLFFIKSKY